MTGAALAHAFAVLAAALVFGGMAFFSFVVAPLVFRQLAKETAAGFMRAAFPLYYAVMAGASALAALAAAFVGPIEAAIMAVVAALFVVLRQLLLPVLNAHRARDDAASDAAFRRLHGLSMVVNLVQLIAVAVALARLAS